MIYFHHLFTCTPDREHFPDKNKLISGFFEGNAKVVDVLLEKYVPIRDFAANAPKDNYYHSFINVLLVNGVSLIEEQKSYFESGKGYIDLIIKSSRSNEEIVILELNHPQDENSDVDLIAREDMDQIIRKKYAESYVIRHDVKAVNAYGICFVKENVLFQERN
ncbi:MAG: PD-(D/E)XK nuclease domain-containing protein [Succinivibrionaceae bacterium]